MVLNSVASNAKLLGVQQIDLVADMYYYHSVKNCTRDARGIGHRVLFSDSDKLPYDFSTFLTNSDNKTDLNLLIAQLCTSSNIWEWEGDFRITKGMNILSRIDSVEYEQLLTLCPDPHEEADNRMIVHIRDMLENGIKSILLRTNDSDVIVILIGFMTQFLEWDTDVKIWVDFGTGIYRKNIFINDVFEYLGESVSMGILFFHAFTGCDSTSSFFKKSKATWFKSWLSYPLYSDITPAFQCLSWLPTDEVIRQFVQNIEHFVYYVYSGKANDTLDELRFQRFASSTNNNCFRELPPSSEALYLHIKRSAYQAGWIWGNTVTQHPCPLIQESGWLLNDNILYIKWAKELDSSKMIKLTATCKHKHSEQIKCVSCTCVRNTVSCLKQCSCMRKCIRH